MKQWIGTLKVAEPSQQVAAADPGAAPKCVVAGNVFTHLDLPQEALDRRHPRALRQVPVALRQPQRAAAAAVSRRKRRVPRQRAARVEARRERRRVRRPRVRRRREAAAARGERREQLGVERAAGDRAGVIAHAREKLGPLAAAGGVAAAARAAASPRRRHVVVEVGKRERHAHGVEPEQAYPVDHARKVVRQRALAPKPDAAEALDAGLADRRLRVVRRNLAVLAARRRRRREVVVAVGLTGGGRFVHVCVCVCVW